MLFALFTGATATVNNLVAQKLHKMISGQYLHGELLLAGSFFIPTTETFPNRRLRHSNDSEIL